MNTPATAASSSSLQVDQPNACIILAEGDSSLTVSIKRPVLVFEGQLPTKAEMPVKIKGDISSGQPLLVKYPPLILADGTKIDVTLFAQWSRKEQVLRKWASMRITGARPLLLKEIILEKLQPPSGGFQFEPGEPQSYPVFSKGAFAGIEFPVASTRIEGHVAVLAHRPGKMLQPRAIYETRKAVYGVATQGAERIVFKRYIASHRPTPHNIHLNYNSWWTSPVPFSEKNILDLMKSFEEKLYKPYGVSFDTFAIDLGWSKKKGVWEINRDLFPEEFSRISKEAKRMKASLGLWISPTNKYSPDSFDNEWARSNGYETFLAPGWTGQPMRMACLGGRRYADTFRDRLLDMITRYNIRHIKLDGYDLSCPESNHGHQPGEISSEAIAEGGIRAFKAMRKAAPDVWLETTCFGYTPSPWWLFYVNSVIGTYGGDAPRGRVPSPVYRQSYTTQRDYYNLKGAMQIEVPIAAQEVLGVIHQSPDPFLDDAVTAILRGHAFLSFYFNPKFMDENRWKQLAGVFKWARSKRGHSLRNNAHSPGVLAGGAPCQRSSKKGRCHSSLMAMRIGAGQKSKVLSRL